MSFGLAIVPRDFISLTKPIPFLFWFKGSYVIIYLNDILFLAYSKHAEKRTQTFLCSLFICHGLCITFSMSELHYTQHFSLLGLGWGRVDLPVSLPSDKPLEVQ